MRRTQQFVPAMRFNWLTQFFDMFLQHALPEKRFKSKLLKLANIEGNQHILDFGCGTGTLVIMIKNINPKAAVFGVDVDSNVLKIAAKKVAEEKSEIFLSTYDGITLPYADNAFDKVISTLVFHHLTREQKIRALAEILRVLKKDGELYIWDFGKTNNILLRVLFFIWRLLDGLENTRDNFNGILPVLIAEAGFNNVRETKEDTSIFGTLYFYSANKIDDK